MTPKRLLTSGEVSRRVGMTPNQISKMCRRNLLPFTVAGKQRLFREEDLAKIKAAGIKAGFVQDLEPVTAATS